MQTGTIAAISTALGNGGISIIRISGEQAVIIADKIFKGKRKDISLKEQKTHTIHYGYIYDDGDLIDEVLLLLMKGPNSYTKEDIVEIDCHGGIVVTKKIMETILKNGARVAEPGEFTKRAFLNGRIDLSQAESVMDIIAAKNELALKASVGQLRGNIFEKIKQIRESIIHDVAFIETVLDDPEHFETDGFEEELAAHLEKNLKELRKLKDSADDGRKIREGIRTVILGKPNAGKSSLLNILAGEERAIVTNIPGTTRDTLEETIQIHGLSLNIIDTAGIRDTEDIVEKIGVDKAKKSAQDADLIIYVVDGSTDLDENDEKIIELICDRQAVVLLNKNDLDIKISEEELLKRTGKAVISISAKERRGIEKLEQTLKDMFFKGELNFNDEVYITNIRHRYAVEEAYESLKLVKKSIEDHMPEDFYSIDLMSAYDTLGTITGESTGEDLVNTIFSEFCVGK